MTLRPGSGGVLPSGSASFGKCTLPSDVLTPYRGAGV
jgi:hypothetical protein